MIPLWLLRLPASSPLEVVTSPKRPRQPVPASDGSDYLKTIPGFSQIRAGGTNGDPVFRGMFGSRLRILTNNGEMLGPARPEWMPPALISPPESFDLLTLTKGPQTVLWGPGNSAGTIRFDREQPRFDKPGVQGNASLLAASNNRWDENADISLVAKMDICASWVTNHVPMTIRMVMAIASPQNGINGTAIWRSAGRLIKIP
ncbi:TonB-dependent receptor plug domain-containing protein [Klebsiella variicola subsp. variicola]|nr:TonB-dependent receptor plug domain-containing protein [Klebsiella variicola subsp. variicola]